jgi:hypothetical protein
MKTTLELPDELMRAIKIRAVHENKRLKDVVAQLLERGMASESPAPAPRHRVKLPLITGRAATPETEITPERLAEILNDQEAGWYLESAPEPV